MGSGRPSSRTSLQVAERGIGVRLRHAVGLRQTFAVGGVKYRELSTERLKHALSRAGRGYKDYEVSFPAGVHMRIRATQRRVFADLVGPRLLPVYMRAESVLRPGMRVLLLEAGTGYAAEWVAGRVAPSGAVVALDCDGPSIAYAQQRYPSPIVSFEQGRLEAVAGETEGSFDAVFAIGVLREDEDAEATLSELWRLLGPAGWLMAACPIAPIPAVSGDSAGAPLLPLRQEPLAEMLQRATRPAPSPSAGEIEGGSRRGELPATISAIGNEQDGWAAAVAVKPFEPVL